MKQGTKVNGSLRAGAKAKRKLLGVLAAGMLVATVGAGAGTAAWAASGHAHGHAEAAHALKLNAGKKWASDEPLRRSMTKIRDAVDAKLPDAHRGRLSAAQYDALGAEIEARVAHIVANCKLEPQADEVLHAIIAGMMQGNETLQGRNPKLERSAGILEVAHSLEEYGRYFEHPGWKAPQAARRSDRRH